MSHNFIYCASGGYLYFVSFVPLEDVVTQTRDSVVANLYLILFIA